MERRDGGILDLVGLHCPLPALKTRRALARLARGDRLVVLADDPLATLDIPHLVAEDGHLLVESRREGGSRCSRSSADRIAPAREAPSAEAAGEA